MKHDKKLIQKWINLNANIVLLAFEDIDQHLKKQIFQQVSDINKHLDIVDPEKCKAALEGKQYKNNGERKKI